MFYFLKKPKKLFNQQSFKAIFNNLIHNKGGGTQRREAAAKAIESLGGTLESMYYAFGDTDLYAVMEVPDHATVVAASLFVNAAGTTSVTRTLLLEPEVIDEASKKSPTYRPPSQ